MRMNNCNYKPKHGLMMAYIATWFIAPILEYGSIYRVLVIGAMMLFALSTILSGRIRMEYAIILFLIVYIAIIGFFTGVPITKHMGAFIFMSCTLIVLYFSTCEEPWRYIRIIHFVYLLCIIFNLTTIRELLVNPNVMRFLVRNSDISVSLSKSGVGGYGYCYTVLCIIPFAIGDIVKRERSFFEKCLCVLFLLTSYFMIFKSGYFMSMILAVLCGPLFFLCRIKDQKRRAIYIVVLLVAAIMLSVSFEGIADTLITHTDNNLIQRKISEIVSLASGDSASIADGEFGTRYQRYMKDFRLMFTSPIWGTWGVNNGNHSYILDFFASYGLILGGVYFSSLLRIIKSTYIEYSPASQTMLYILVIVLSLNAMAPSLGFVLFVLMPIYSSRDALEEQIWQS